MVSYAVDHELGKQLLEWKSKGTIKEEKKDEKEIDGLTPENFPAFWEHIKDTLPLELASNTPGVDKRFVMGTFKREDLRKKLLGIQLNTP